MRSGTSKGLFLLRDKLPKFQSEWATVLLPVMGTGDQMDGIGSGKPTASKVAVVAKSIRPEFQIEYTFVQVDAKVGNMSGTCGNLAAGAAPFALQQGLVKVPPGEKLVSESCQVFQHHTPECEY